MGLAVQPEPTLATAQAYDGQIIKVRVDTVGLADGRQAQREIVVHPSSVCVVPVDSDSNVILVRQYRKAVETSLLEVPAGKMEDGEEPEETALRELREEIGHYAGVLTSLAGFYVAPVWCTQYMHIYLATDLKPDQLAPDDDEFIAPERVRISDIPLLISDGHIRDGKSIASLLLAMRVLGDN